ncbi:hypothetical protein MKX01_032177 [Papaver californicum]|nr:hypothetical protein MKX01_032177 [Papaver californicum]
MFVKERPDATVDRLVLYLATHVYKNIPDDRLHPKHIAVYLRGMGDKISKT